MNKEDLGLLEVIADMKGTPSGAYNIRKDGNGVERKVTENVNIVTKKEVSGIDIFVKENTKNETIYIPVIVTIGGLKDVTYNDFYIGKNASVTIVAGCGIHNDCHEDSQHDGIHRFFLEEGASVKYIEKHYGEGKGTGGRILNPVTEINLKDKATMELESIQIKGVDSTVRVTKADLEGSAKLVINEKIMTTGEQYASTEFEVNLDGEDSSVQVNSRSVATEKSLQKFVSKVMGNNKCFAHVSCDAIIKDEAKVTSIPEITAANVDASLIHEAAIGKIAKEQLVKLMTLGFSAEEAEEKIIEGFLK